MTKNNYKAIADFCKENNIKFAVITDESEICPTIDLNGFDFIDTETFEIPTSFNVDRCLTVCLDTPNMMTPEDTAESYDKYYNIVTKLRELSRPQYIAVDGSYIKLMCWCDWSGEEDPKREFLEACKDALELIKDNEQYTGCPIDFRLFIDKDVTPFIFSCSEIDKMWDFVKNIVDWDIEIYANFPDANMAETTDHGVRYENVCGMRYLTAY